MTLRNGMSAWTGRTFRCVCPHMPRADTMCSLQEWMPAPVQLTSASHTYSVSYPSSELR